MPVTLEKGIPIPTHTRVNKDPRTDSICKHLAILKNHESIFIDIREPNPPLPQGHEPDRRKLLIKDKSYVSSVVREFCKRKFNTTRYSSYFIIAQVNNTNECGIRVWRIR